MPNKKIVCLGGGSLYFPGAIADLVVRKDLAESEIVLYDIDPEKARQVADTGSRLAKDAATGMTVSVADELPAALDGADFAISSIGGSGAAIAPSVYGTFYHAADMHIAAKYGLCQVIGDTGGPAGMMMGMRAVGAYLEICEQMEKYCPRAILFSHSNPMAILCRAMTKYSDIQVIGICHGVQETIRRIAETLNLPAAELNCRWIGTNHYYWFTRVGHLGRDLTDELLAKVTELSEDESDNLWRRLSAAYGVVVGIPSNNHLIEFYPWATRVKRLDDLPADLAACARRHGFDDTKPMPARQPTDEMRTKLQMQYRQALDAAQLPPEPDDTNWLAGEGLARIIAAISHHRRYVCIVNIPNDGLIPNLPATAIVEVEALTDSTGVRGIAVGDCPLALKGLLEKRLAWQEMVVDAAATGDRRLALQAMLLDEMSLSPQDNQAMLEELLLASRDRLPQFFT